VDSIRQVDVDLNFLLVLYSSVGLYRFVCLVDWIYVGKFFEWAEYIGRPPSVNLGWATATLPPRFPRLCRPIVSENDNHNEPDNLFP